MAQIQATQLGSALIQKLAPGMTQIKSGLIIPKSAAASYEPIGGAIKKTKNKMDTLGHSTAMLAWNIQLAGYLLAGFGAALLLPIKKSAEASIDFESSFACVRTTVEATEPQFKQLQKDFRNMAKQIPVDVNEINKLGESAGQLGIPIGSMKKFVRTVADLGATTNVTSDEAATSLAKLSNRMGIINPQYDRMGSVVVALGNKYASTESEILSMALRMAATGKTVGLNERQVLGFANAMASVGIKAQMGGSAFSKTMARMASAGGKHLSAFAKVTKMSGGQFQKSFKKDPAGTYVAFIKGLKGMKESGVNLYDVLKELGITEVRTVDTILSSVNASDLMEKSLKDANKAWGDNNALTTEAQKRYNTIAAKIKITKNKLNDVGITVGNIFRPAILRLLDVGNKLIDWFARLDPLAQKFIVWGVAIAGIVAIMAGGLLIFGGMIGMIIIGLGATASALGVAGLGAGAFVGALLPIIGTVALVIGVFLLIGYAVYSLIKNWDALKEAVGYLWRDISKAFNDILDSVTTTMSNLWSDIKSGWGIIASFFTSTIPATIAKIIAWFAKLPGSISAFLSTLAGRIAYWIGFGLGRMVRVVVTGIGKTIAWFAKLPGRVWGFIKNMASKIYTGASAAANGLIKATVRGVRIATEWFAKLPGRVWGFIKRIPGRILQAGANIYNAAKSIGQSAWDGLRNKVSGIPGMVWDFIKGIPGRILKAGSDFYSSAKSLALNMWKGFLKGLKGSPKTKIEYAIIDMIGASDKLLNGFKNDLSKFNLSIATDNPQLLASRGPVNSNSNIHLSFAGANFNFPSGNGKEQAKSFMSELSKLSKSASLARAY